MSAEIEQAAAERYRELGDLYRRRDAADAEVYYRRSLRFAPDAAGVHAGLAAALFRLNRFGEAEEHLARARALDPAHDEAACLWAELMVAHGRVPEALETYQLGLGSGGSLRLRTEYADLLARLGLLDDAEEEYRHVLAHEERVEARVNLGLVLVERGRPAEALREFERALAEEPESTAAALNRANALIELDRLDAAESALAALVDDVETRGAALWGLAAVYERRGDVHAAAQARVEAVAAAPSLAVACGPSAAADRDRSA